MGRAVGSWAGMKEFVDHLDNPVEQIRDVLGQAPGVVQQRLAQPGEASLPPHRFSQKVVYESGQARSAKPSMGLLSPGKCFYQREEAFLWPLSSPYHRGNSNLARKPAPRNRGR